MTTTTQQSYLVATPAEVWATHARSPWCQDDHSGPTPARVDLSCYLASDGVVLPLEFDGDDQTGGDALFTYMSVHPFWDEQDGRDVPHVNLQVVDGVWLPVLGPEQLAQVIAKLRARLDELEHEVLPQLSQARADWMAGRCELPVEARPVMAT
ncbi:DUF6907 domain-containing protein [Streptomyces sp. NPDC004609]|uniref:DUF6907 domain-containing protein n=1 Tax=Streptomyces sp. NPDC004609 TaxID=3364704 RepID=UPI0036781438